MDEESGTVENISVYELEKLLTDKNQKICIIDVRTEQEYNLVHMNDTILIPLDTIENGESIPKIRELASTNKLILHCKLGGRSAKATIALKRFDIPAYNLSGGIDAWAKEVDPTMIRY